MLAPYACHVDQSRGRHVAEPAPEGRSDFQRDRDRIIHCSAFRRLEYKTQVFVNHEGDLFRTRLTHSLEVAQIARTLARSLQLNEDLIEAIALAHDLGHTPFGHAGQEALNTCLNEWAPQAGGFEHNLQSLRIVDVLETRYADFDGLNLCFETREGILKHCSRRAARDLGDVGQRFLDGTRPSLEAQLTNLADEIAYNNHDIDDGLRSGLLRIEQLREVAIFEAHYERVRAHWPKRVASHDEKRLVAETIRAMINTLVLDLTRTTAENIARVAPESVDAVRAAPTLAAFSPDMREQATELKRFLREALYRHPQVMRMMRKAQRIVRELFQTFVEEPHLLDPEYRRDERIAQARVVADYIAGMTDRYAIREHRMLTVMG